MVSRIVITGAPGSGKTEFMHRLKTTPVFAGFVFFDELARQLLASNPGFRNDWMRFHLEIYRRQTSREDAVAGRPFVTDRGTLDAFAFHPSAMTAAGTTVAREFARYDAVLHLGSAATLGEPFYVRDEIRRESPAEALTIEEAIRKIWSGHPGYHFLPAREDFHSKYEEFLAAACRLVPNGGLDNRSASTSLS